MIEFEINAIDTCGLQEVLQSTLSGDKTIGCSPTSVPAAEAAFVPGGLQVPKHPGFL